MGESTKISWSDATYNPWWGCTRVSDGCTRCYAETFSKRLGLSVWGKGNDRRVFGDKHWNEPHRWNEAAREDGVRRRVFCASMADVFEDHPIAERERPRLWSLIEATPMLDWLLLTKRPENMRAMAPWSDWPWNVWAGTTVENRKHGVPRIDILRDVPARVRFLSCEPLLEDLGRLSLDGIHWLIAGAESGHHARPMDLAWVRSLRDQCQAAGVAFFFKQQIVAGRKAETPEIDGRKWTELPR